MVKPIKIDLPSYLDRRVLGFVVGKTIYAAGGASVGYAVDKSLGGDGLIGAAAGSLTGLIFSEVHRYIEKFRMSAADKIIGKLEPSEGNVRILRNIQREARHYWQHLEKLSGPPPEIPILGGLKDMDAQVATLYVALRKDKDNNFVFYNYEDMVGEKATPESVAKRFETEYLGCLGRDPETLVLLFSKNVKKALAKISPDEVEDLEKRLIEN